MPTSMVESGPLRFAKRLHGVGGALQVDVELAVWIAVSAETRVAVELSEAVGRCAEGGGGANGVRMAASVGTVAASLGVI
jgi:hypothetical protein